jgi:hypothetical protein
MHYSDHRVLFDLLNILMGQAHIISNNPHQTLGSMQIDLKTIFLLYTSVSMETVYNYIHLE